MIAHLDGLVDRFAGLRALVLGDVVLDAYVEAQATGLAREAPVPALRLGARHHHPGGAANAARNLAALGAGTVIVGVVGGDVAGARLTTSLAACGVDTGALVVEADRATTVLRRVQVDGRVLLRLDEGGADAVSATSVAAMADALARHWSQVDAVVVSDYGRGTVTDAVRHQLALLQQHDPRLLVVDARQVAAYRTLVPTVVKPNWPEAVTLLDPPDPNPGSGSGPGSDPDPDPGPGPDPDPGSGSGASGGEPLDEASARERAARVVANAGMLHARTGARIVAVTLDADGAVVLEQGYPPYRTFARPAVIRSTVGAGDAFTAAFTLALAAGGSVPVAAELASQAADVVTSRDRTSACSARDLLGVTAGPPTKTTDRSALAARLAQERAAGRRIVFTNGCFDILHLGHVNLLNRAKSMGDVLVVGLNSDAGVARLKGPNRPINSAPDRMGVLSALSCVDHLVCFDEDTAEGCLRALLPHVYVKGGDYTEASVPEAGVAAALGIDLRIVPLVEARSTTAMIERIQGTAAGGAGGGP